MRTKPIFPILWVLSFSLLLPAQHPLTIADLGLLKGISDARISPDGTAIAYTRATTDYAGNGTYSEVVIINALTGARLRNFSGSSPRWAPNSKSLAYRASQPGQSGIWVWDLASPGPRFLTEVLTTDHWLGAGAVKNLEWSPDSATIAFLNADAPGAPPQGDVREYSRIMYKTRTGFSDNRKTHIWTIPAAGGTAKILTPGQYDEHSITWSPDGRKIAFVSNHTGDPDNNYADHIFIAEVPSGITTQLTRTTGTEFRPAWSPDGSLIAYLGWVRARNTKDSPAEDTQLYVAPTALGGGPPRKLSAAVDRRISDLDWHPNSRSIYCSAGDRGAVVVFRIAVDRGTAENVTSGNNSARQFSLEEKGLRMAWIQSDMTHPAEVWSGGADGRNARQLTHDNDEFLAAIASQDAETFWFESFDGTRVQGWVMKPAGFQAGKKYPGILYVHGGPHGMYGFAFSERFQWMSAQGYAVVFINPRGSSGYGQAFSDGTLLNWGGGDYKDLMAGLDYALSHYAWIDSARLGVIGGSYGGFMTNWIVTQTHRFKAAVAIASLSDLISFYGTSLYSDLIEAEFDGLPWENYPMLWQWSPLSHVKNVTTPTLFLHGEADHDVPITQAEEMYVALRKLGIESSLVRYPNEGHGFTQPQHVMDEHRRTAEWFARYLQ